jgi:hypothetical protein
MGRGGKREGKAAARRRRRVGSAKARIMMLSINAHELAALRLTRFPLLHLHA